MKIPDKICIESELILWFCGVGMIIIIMLAILHD